MLKAANGKILVKLTAPNEKSKGGIVLPNSVEERSDVSFAEVVEVGTTSVVDRQMVNPEIYKGMKLYFSKHNGTLVEHDSEKYYVIRSIDVLCWVAG